MECKWRREEEDAIYFTADQRDVLMNRLAESECQAAELRRLLSAEQHRSARLRAFVQDATRWRESCREADEDMDHAPRDFSDDEEWEILEECAQRALAEQKEV